MKTLTSFFLVLGVVLSRAQPADYGHDPEWDKQYDHSYTMAVKLFPDVAIKDSQMNVIMEKMLWVLEKNNSQIAHLPCAPVVVAMEAADIVRIEPNWKELSEEEQDEVFRDIRTSLVSTRDFDTKEAQSQAHVQNQKAPTITVGAFDCYLYELTSGHTDGHGRFISGPAAGYDRDQAAAFARQQWLQMSDEQKMVYEKMVEETGDPIAQQQAAQANAPVPVRILQGQGQ